MDNINIEDIESKWFEVKSCYNDMHERLSYIPSKNVNHKLSDNMVILLSDMNNMIINMEKVCNTVDDIYAKKGKIEKTLVILSKNKNVNVINSEL